MFLGVVLVSVTLVPVVNVLTGMMLVAVALVYVVDVARLVAMMLMAVAFVYVVNVFVCVVFVFVALVRVVDCFNHSGASHIIDTVLDRARMYQNQWVVNLIKRNSPCNRGSQEAYFRLSVSIILATAGLVFGIN